ncbi:MAG: HAD family hydrolase [Myxococcota bacterium]
MRPLVFDLDQTLLRGEDVDWATWLASIEEALGVAVPMDQDWTSYPVHTDHGLVREISRRHRGREITPEEWATFERAWLARLADILVAYTPVAGAAAMLATVTRAGIATGNLHRATQLKLRHSGLDHFGLPCTCSDDAPDRAALVRACLEGLGWRPGEPATSVGDGVWDVRAARALGIGFVGVAQSDAHEERLRAHGASHVVRDFTDLEAFRAAVGACEAPR